MRGLTAVLVVSLVVPLPTLSAQQSPPIEPGARVRVTAPECFLDQQAGTLQPSRGDTLVLAYGFDSFPCLQSNVTRLEVAAGQKRHIVRGALMGLAIGGGGLAIIGAIATAKEPCIDSPDPCPALGAILGAMLGAPSGLVIGGVIGALSKTDRWEEVPLDRLRVSFAPQRDGFALGLSVSF